MGHIVDIYRFNNSIEYEYKWAGNYGAKGEKRAAKEEITPEQMKRQNQWKRETTARRTMKLNFGYGDLWCTILYPKGTRKKLEDVKDDLRKFTDRLRKVYRKRGEDFRWMRRIEIGSRGGIHIHMVCNHIRGEPGIDLVIQEAWTEGRVHFERLKDGEDDYRRLSSYLVKPLPAEQEEKLDDKEKKALVSYSTSRNLSRPKPERKRYLRRTVRKLVEEGPQATRGYAIDKDSVRMGINPYTGMSYLYYTEVRIDPGGGSG